MQGSSGKNSTATDSAVPPAPTHQSQQIHEECCISALHTTIHCGTVLPALPRRRHTPPTRPHTCTCSGNAAHLCSMTPRVQTTLRRWEAQSSEDILTSKLSVLSEIFRTGARILAPSKLWCQHKHQPKEGIDVRWMIMAARAQSPRRGNGLVLIAMHTGQPSNFQ